MPLTERTALLPVRKLKVQRGLLLLLADTVGSNWTMTAVGWLLREVGSGPVYPLALADTAGRSG